ncbi:nuclear transport factor 2 family protein [Pedococcus sp.]|jgi:ketosteroid isomerase-like protein|uniref:nuclear transport factor 2 family protein n=1 Tax=Pedococcus sp. TaxID=2860345 RepID=UPI002E0D40A8|nr:nuclear transport factor 2 family protein [Pedococcus sp.]
MTDSPATPSEAVARLFDRTNAHDLDGLVACFAADYTLTNPAHPARDFVGTDQVRRNWNGLFAGVPDLVVTVHRLVAAGEHVWVELAMDGTRRDGTPLRMAGVQIFTVRGGLVRGCRFYLEPVDPVAAAALDADGAVRQAVSQP